MILESVQGAASLLHHLPKPVILDESSYHVATIAQVLDALNIGLDFFLEIFDLTLILGSESLYSLVEDLFLLVFLSSELFVIVEEFNLFFEDTLIVGGESVEKVVLLAVFLHNFLIHFCKVLLG